MSQCKSKGARRYDGEGAPYALAAAFHKLLSMRGVENKLRGGVVG